MSDEKLTAYYGAPFVPIPASTSGAGIEIDAALRMAHAAEYTAAQLGIIARAAEKIEAHLSKIAGSNPEGLTLAEMVTASFKEPDQA
ncbi:hypothetical protein GCM10007874_29080 [Labrys miyagiensis]|uniref:Uncharacterized protein n=1 Tax=Labrys miyagiensis TaxID=346912 RepID=A0ABQ6CI37_9HYPH|nr:hypothetical protein [Labrys miyagiensis]GLS19891.1 hypothetical protein GCM10007874_29080 [Labrys miyagiensis]